MKIGGLAMAKVRMYGMKCGYTPNSKDDMRYRKKVYQRGRETTIKTQNERSQNDHEYQNQQKKDAMPL